MTHSIDIPQHIKVVISKVVADKVLSSMITCNLIGRVRVTREHRCADHTKVKMSYVPSCLSESSLPM